MRVFRTDTIANSAATKKPFANTSTISAATRHRTAATDSSTEPSAYNATTKTRRHETRPVFFVFLRVRGLWLRLTIGKEVGVDEAVDHRLVGRVDLLELDPHPDTPIAPGDASLGVDVALRPGHAEAHLDLRGRIERAGGADRDAAMAQIERQGGRDRIAVPVLDRDAEHNARAGATIEIVGEEMRCD